MHFYRPKTTRSQVAIIPLIDILFVLLIFIIVTSVPKKPRDVLRIELPTVREVPSDTVADVRSTIAVDKLGNVTLDSLVVPDGLLENYLIAYKKENPDRRLELEADRNIPLERLLKIWDALTKSGIEIKDVPARIKTGK